MGVLFEAKRISRYLESRTPILRCAALIVLPPAHYYVEHQALWALGFAVLFAVCGPVLLALFIALHLAHYIVLAWEWIPPPETFLLLHVLLALAAAWRGGLVAVPRGRTAEWKRLWLWERNALFVLGAGVALSMTLRAVSLFDAGCWALLFLLLSWGVHRAHGLARPRVEWASLLLLAASVMVGLVVLEVGVRITFGDVCSHRGIYAAHPRYLYTLHPGFSGKQFFQLYEDESAEIPVSISMQGLRDRACGPRKDNEFRILLLGDSYTFGWALAREHTLSYLLEERLKSHGLPEDISVINAGVSGYGPWQEHGLLIERGYALEPNLIILQTFMANDIADTLRQEGKRLDAFFVDAERFYDWWLCFNHWIIQMDDRLSAHSRACALASRFLGPGGLPLLCAEQCRLLAPPPEVHVSQPKSHRHAMYEPDLDEWYPMLQHGWQLLKTDIQAIRDDCQERGIAFAAYNVPFPVDEAEAFEYFAKKPETCYELDKGTRMMEAFFEEAEIPSFSVLDTFRSHNDPGSLGFSKAGHTNENGNELIADAMDRFVLDHHFPH